MPKQTKKIKLKRKKNLRVPPPPNEIELSDRNLRSMDPQPAPLNQPQHVNAVDAMPFLLKYLPKAWSELKFIATNIYPENLKQLDHEECGCLGDGKVCETGELCVNVAMKRECPRICHEFCQNDKLTKKRNSEEKIDLFFVSPTLYGVKATKPINEGDFIMEYVGEVVTLDEYERRLTREYKEDADFGMLYAMQLKQNPLTGNIRRTIDAHRYSNKARFLNHSCEPNCEIEEIIAGGYQRVGIFAKMNIEPGTELTYHYDFKYFKWAKPTKCFCGKRECKGIVGERKRYYCNHGDCKKHYAKRLYLAAHIRTHHRDDIPRLSCPSDGCPSTFGRKTELNEHMKNKHARMLSEQQANKQQGEKRARVQEMNSEDADSDSDYDPDC